jgi:nitrite reductase/ring-hydroxylating ferredoxin subunit
MDDSPTWIRVARASDVAEGEMLAVQAAGRKIALYHLDDDTWAATGNVCSHAFALLTDGWLDGAAIECPLHAGRFDVRTGKALSAPVEEDVPAYQVRIEGGDVLVAVPA